MDTCMVYIYSLMHLFLHKYMIWAMVQEALGLNQFSIPLGSGELHVDKFVSSHSTFAYNNCNIWCSRAVSALGGDDWLLGRRLREAPVAVVLLQRRRIHRPRIWARQKKMTCNGTTWTQLALSSGLSRRIGWRHGLIKDSPHTLRHAATWCAVRLRLYQEPKRRFTIFTIYYVYDIYCLEVLCKYSVGFVLQPLVV